MTRTDSPGQGSGAAASIPRVGSTLADRFLLREVLGIGATGTVFSAVDTTVGQRVAVKVLHPNLRDDRIRERLRREVRTSRSGHPNIVSVFDLHETADQLFLSMELVEGRSLKQDLRDSGGLEIEAVVRLGRAVASALEHLHDSGLVHRDVKPGNILLASDGTIKLCDMGLARPTEAGVTVTEAEMVVGTPDYMAPEQATAAVLSPASDVYGLGLTLYQSLTGEIPLKEETAIATLTARQHRRPPTARRIRPECPRWLDRLIRRMLEPNPRERPTAGRVVQALNSRRTRPRIRRKTAAVGLTAVVILLVGMVGTYQLIRRPTVAVEITETAIFGRDGRGETTWRMDLGLPILTRREADLDGDGVNEIGIVTGVLPSRQAERSQTLAGPEVWIFNRAGRILTHFLPEDQLNWPYAYDHEIQASLFFLDLDHDGLPEPLVVGRHLHFFPTAVFVCDRTMQTWRQALSHPGYIRSVQATPPGSAPGFRILAVNNQIGVLNFIGEVFVDPPALASGDIGDQFNTGGLLGPPRAGASRSPSMRWQAYVPVGLELASLGRPGVGISNLPDGGVEVNVGRGSVIRFDRFLNRENSVNAGRDLRALRWRFMTEIHLLRPDFQTTSPTVLRRMLADQDDRFRPLLEEPAYRLIRDVLSARALARVGDLVGARRILADSIRAVDHPDAVYLLASLDALAGDFDGASRRLDRLISTADLKAAGTRGKFDGPHLALRIGIQNRNPELVHQAIAGLTHLARRPDLARVAQSLEARANLWWTELQPEDLEVTSTSYAPAGAAIACLARWRLGRSHPDDVERMTAFIERNPDAETEGRLALAAALLAANDAHDALDHLDILEQSIRFTAGADFSLHQLLNLTRAMRVVALEADGQVDRARTEGAALLPDLTPDLLPAVLVEEALNR